MRTFTDTWEKAQTMTNIKSAAYRQGFIDMLRKLAEDTGAANIASEAMQKAMERARLANSGTNSVVAKPKQTTEDRVYSKIQRIQDKARALRHALRRVKENTSK